MNFGRAVKLMTAAASLVIAQFYLFGKFLTYLAPPVADVDANVGMASMISLIILLLVTLWGKDKAGEAYNKIAIRTSVTALIIFVIAFFCYDHLEGEYVYRYPPSETQAANSDRYIRGNLHEEGHRRIGKQSVATAVFDLGGPDYVVAEQLLWTDKSQRNVARLLTATYLVIVIAFGAALYLLLVRFVDSKPAKGKK